MSKTKSVEMTTPTPTPTAAAPFLSLADLKKQLKDEMTSSTAARSNPSTRDTFPTPDKWGKFNVDADFPQTPKEKEESELRAAETAARKLIRKKELEEERKKLDAQKRMQKEAAAKSPNQSLRIPGSMRRGGKRKTKKRKGGKKKRKTHKKKVNKRKTRRKLYKKKKSSRKTKRRR